MTTNDQADSQRAQLIRDYAAGLLKSGVSNHTILKKLIEFGVDADAALQILAELQAAPQPKQRRAGDVRKEIRERATREGGVITMASGVALAAVGIGITLFSFQNASKTGGFFLVTYGLIFAGLAQFVRGLIQITTGKR